MPTSALQAAIRRATLAVHKDVERLDERALRDLERIYREAASGLTAAIEAHAGPEGSIAIQELRSLREQVEARIAALGEARNSLVDANLARAAELAVRPYAAVLAAPAAMSVSHRAVEFVRSFVAEDGLQLSDRLWRIDRGARDLVVNQIEQSVVLGHGAAQAARELLLRGERVPGELQAKAALSGARGIAQRAENALLRGAGNPMDNALRLMRTEINRAHGEAYMMGGEDLPDFGAWQYLLSPAHPEPDICDLLSTQNLYGLGPGCYPSREKTPWPAHPNTLSFIVIKFKGEITAAERAGKETPLEALARLTPEQRAGALGKGKSEIFDAGRLRQGMIRSPLAAVRKRLRTPLRPE